MDFFFFFFDLTLKFFCHIVLALLILSLLLLLLFFSINLFLLCCLLKLLIREVKFLKWHYYHSPFSFTFFFLSSLKKFIKKPFSLLRNFSFRFSHIAIFLAVMAVAVIFVVNIIVLFQLFSLHAPVSSRHHKLVIYRNL